MILSVTDATGKFWDGVQIAGDYYDVIGGGICGCFLVVGGLSVLCYKPWRRWMDRRHGKNVINDEERYRDDAPDSGDGTGVFVHEAGSRVDRGQTEVVGKGGSHIAVKATDEPRITEEIL
jgi:hypothetical protein